MRDILIKDIMIKSPITIHVDEPFRNVAEKLRTHGIRHLPVVDASHHVMGMVSERDLFRTVPPHRTEEGFCYEPGVLDSYILKRVMTPNPSVLKQDAPISKAVHLMTERRYGCIPVVDDDGAIVGVITPLDILKYIGKQLV